MFPEREIFVETQYAEKNQKGCAVDLPLVALNFPYMRETDAKMLEFDPKYLAQQASRLQNQSKFNFTRLDAEMSASRPTTTRLARPKGLTRTSLDLTKLDRH